MPAIGKRCHELRINDENSTWRVIYRIDDDAIVILEVFSKKTAATPKGVVNVVRKRLERYDSLVARDGDEEVNDGQDEEG